MLPLRAAEVGGTKNKATLVVEYGLDSLERRYYHPVFRFDFSFRGGTFFSQVEYHSRMNGRLQGAIDYWVDAGLQKELNDRLRLELRLNHFCRHQTVRDTAYVWNLNEVLGRAIVERGRFTLALGAGGFIGGSDGYRRLVTMAAECRGFIVPELSIAAELKLVNFARLNHECGFFLALNRAVDIFFRNARHYEFPSTSYLGLRFRSAEETAGFLDAVKVLIGASPFDKEFKLEIEGDFRLEFFPSDSRRVVVGVEFESPILNGDGFFAQFWPGKMIYDIGINYEKAVAPGLFSAWIARYRLDMPVDMGVPFASSLFTGLALRNQPDFDVPERDVRFDIAAGYDFKHGLEIGCKLGLGIWQSGSVKAFSELRTRVGGGRIRLDLRLLGSLGGAVQIRPYLGWKKEIALKPEQEIPGKFLFGLGFFKSFSNDS
ncbi:MAG: hypothetical protein JXO51_00980 [Candidatus Aminicenantes bacterium]|nr:hypothetical protein [Candidatus Aminicenantes bacterium]